MEYYNTSKISAGRRNLNHNYTKPSYAISIPWPVSVQRVVVRARTPISKQRVCLPTTMQNTVLQEG